MTMGIIDRNSYQIRQHQPVTNEGTADPIEAIHTHIQKCGKVNGMRPSAGKHMWQGKIALDFNK